jgi:hypothetical protein
MKLDPKDRGEIEAFGDFIVDHREEVLVVVRQLRIDESRIIDFARGTLLLMALGLLHERNYEMEDQEIVDFVNLLLKRRTEEIESQYHQ